ncbi:glutathione S-transferase [Polycladidibacter stylochi]|uniref:glutathione S-transferase n=1 Tax=Polycladidibacter stylochi TaxID=1807766 RepID=UPI00082D9EB9|nr:glutathione S-transferase [Pseudovibrio stylochi]
MSKQPILYSFRRCPYAMRARLALISSNTQVELREIVLRNKPAHMLEISPKGTVPVMILPDATVIDESLDIALWALSRNDPQNWLEPETGTKLQMLDLIAHLDGAFKYHLDHYKYASRYEDADPEVHYNSAIQELEGLEKRLQNSPYLFGSRPALADQMLFPFVRQFCNANKERFQQSAPERVRAWLNRLIETELFTTAFATKWTQWQPGDVPLLFP